MTCIGVCHRSDHVLCIRTTAIQKVQPACPRADTCGMEGAPPSGAAASSVLALGLKGTIRREMHLAFCPSRQVINVVTIFSALRAHHKPMFGVEIARASQELIAHERRLLADYEHATERVRPPDKKTRLAIEGEAWRRLVCLLQCDGIRRSLASIRKDGVVCLVFGRIGLGDHAEAP
jgi:hypothetical protein